ASIYRPDGIFPADTLDHAAQAQRNHVGFDRAVACRPAFRLESESLSRGCLVFQSILLAGAIRLRLMVRARPCTAEHGIHHIADPALLLHRLSYLRADHDLCRTVSGLRRDVPALALFGFQSERQDQPRALPLRAFRGDRDPGDPFRTEGLVGPAVEGIRSD